MFESWYETEELEYMISRNSKAYDYLAVGEAPACKIL